MNIDADKIAAGQVARFDLRAPGVVESKSRYQASIFQRPTRVLFISPSEAKKRSLRKRPLFFGSGERKQQALFTIYSIIV